MSSLRVGSFSNSRTFSPPFATGRGPWRLVGVLRSSPSSSLGPDLHSWCFPPFVVEEEKDLQIESVDANGI